MATEMVPQQLWRAELATMLSQVGCMALPDDLLARAYAGKRLEPREAKAFAEHPRAGHDLVAHVPRLQPVAEIILQQGKCFNGAGFPQDGIAGEAIPVEARILKVALDFDSLTHSGINTTDAFAMLCSRDGHYDKAVLALLQKSIALAAARKVMDVAMV
jgi:response regulator RpfG family c-di-GMP phosphodiesterase